MKVERPKPLVVAAFDPGLEGGVAFMNESHSVLEAHDIPIVGVNKQRLVDGLNLARLIRGAGVTYAIIEHVQSMPRQGVASTFRFGMAFGQLLGIVQGMELPHELVRPNVWKKALGLTGKGTDGAEMSRMRALQRFPSLGEALSRKKDHNRAEAVLLAHWYLETRSRG